MHGDANASPKVPMSLDNLESDNLCNFQNYLAEFQNYVSRGPFRL